MGDIGKIILAGAAGTILWKSFDQGTKENILGGVNALLTELNKPRAHQLPSPSTTASFTPPPDDVAVLRRALASLRVDTPVIEVKPRPIVEVPDDRIWRELIPHPSVVVILGKRGSGKSSLGYWLLELSRMTRPAYVFGVPASAASIG